MNRICIKIPKKFKEVDDIHNNNDKIISQSKKSYGVISVPEIIIFVLSTISYLKYTIKP